MKKPFFFQHLFLIIVTSFSIHLTGNAQIAGTSGSLSVDPVTPTVVDPLITVGGTADLTNATVQITANYYSGDVLSFDAGLAGSFGISGSYSTTDVSGILSFSGTTSPANWQAIFRTVTYENGSASCGPSSRTIIFLQGQYLYNSFNGHYYEYVNDYLNWKDAKAAAELRSLNGLHGYLATSTSDAENNFIWKLISADAWIGASYDYEEVNAATGTTTFPDQNSAISHVYWVTGPEKGTYISSDLGNPIAQNGQYMNWAGGEPNNSGNEYYVELYSGNEGKWNDLPIGSALPYLVEYGGMPDDVPQNNTFSRSLTLTSTVGGDIMGGDVSVCAGSNSTVLTSTAAVPGVTILRWESSTDNFLTPGTVINNTTNTLTVDNLTQTTYFRSIANGNSCSEAPSSSTKITVGTSVAGTLAAAFNTICNNSVAQLTLTGNNGNIIKWQSSPDNSSWTDIANTSALYTSAPLSPGTYYYQAEVQNLSCPSSVFSNSVMITVTAAAGSVGGTLSGAENACGPDNTGLLTVTGHTGSIVKWQSSTDNGIVWADIVNTSDTLIFNNITATTKYRAVVQNGSCNSVNSSELTVVYSAASNRWNGTNSTDFGDAGNWDCTVPGPGTSIIIGSGAPNMPILDQDRNIGNITFEANTNIDINGHALTISGALSGTNDGNFTGSASSSLILAGFGDAGTIYFNQASPGISNALNALTINRTSQVIPTPPSSPLCTPDASWGEDGVGITNVTLGSINNTTIEKNGYTNYFSSQSTNVDPSTDYTLSVTTAPGYYDYEGIKVWIDWNNNGIFGDNANEIITDFGGGDPGTYDFTVSAPAIGGDITGGSKTMRVYVENYNYLMWFGFDACYGGLGEYEDYKINLSPVPVSKGQVALGNDLLVDGTLTFTKGVINTSTNMLVLGAGSTASGAGNESYVNGNVRKVGNTPFTFPIGNDTFYAPLSISAPADIADHFTASYIKTDPLSVYTNSNFTNGLIGISNNEYWLLERTNGSSNVEVTLSWDAARSTAITNTGLLRVAHWDGTAWTNAGNSGVTTGDLTAGTVTSMMVSNFSPFTIGISSTILPVTLFNFTAVKTNQKVNLEWQTSAEINSNRFEIERSINGVTWIKIGEVVAQGNSNSSNNYRFADLNPFTGNNYYRLKQFDNDGKFAYSQTRVVNFSNTSNVRVYPNPFTKSLTIDAGNKIIGEIFITDISGKIVFRSKITNTKETINLEHLAAGQYTIIQKGGYNKIIKMP